MMYCCILLLCLALQTFGSSFFLSSTLRLRNSQQDFMVRQVPGDGGCLFHSLAASVDYLFTKTHNIFDHRLEALSFQLRNLAVDLLSQNRTFYAEDNAKIAAGEMLAFVSQHHNISPEEYCRLMRKPATWGGGPEIVALCNHFQCPVYVYSLGTKGVLWGKHFVLDLTARFGHSDFQNRPIHLLSVDGRFPSIKPGEQEKMGNHFMALFPLDEATAGNGLTCCHAAVKTLSARAVKQLQLPLRVVRVLRGKHWNRK